MRVDRWETIFAQALEEGLKRPFEWGEHDCALFAFSIRAAITGKDDTELLRGKYSSAEGVVRVMLRLGWTSYEDGGRCLVNRCRPSCWHSAVIWCSQAIRSDGRS